MVDGGVIARVTGAVVVNHSTVFKVGKAGIQVESYGPPADRIHEFIDTKVSYAAHQVDGDPGDRPDSGFSEARDEHKLVSRNVLERPKPKVLLVDDESANLEVFARAFRKELVVRVAGSGLVALEELSREPVDILLTDFGMPVMDGIALLITVAERWPSIHRVIVSGHCDLAELHDAQRSGLAAVLISKPWSKAEMLEIVDRLMTESTVPSTDR